MPLFDKNCRWNAAINRLYYACFYAVIALLTYNNIETTTHKGARNQLGQKFIKPGLISKEYGQIYSDLFDFRQKGDYGDFFDFDSEKVIPFVERVEKFLNIVKKMINN